MPLATTSRAIAIIRRNNADNLGRKRGQVHDQEKREEGDRSKHHTAAARDCSEEALGNDCVGGVGEIDGLVEEWGRWGVRMWEIEGNWGQSCLVAAVDE